MSITKLARHFIGRGKNTAAGGVHMSLATNFRRLNSYA